MKMTMRNRVDYSRRSVAAGLMLAIGLSLWWLLAPGGPGNVIRADAAYNAWAEGSLTIIDIRRPDEWAQSGTPKGAVRLDLRRPDFLHALSDAMNGQLTTPIAVICATGVRSRRLAAQLQELGLKQVFDISEGMFGGDGGPGWIARGLPLDR